MVGATTRSSEALRTLLRETSFDVGDLIYPVFVHHDPDHYEPIASMPGQYQWGVNHLPRLIDDLLQYQIQSVILFGLPKTKDKQGSASWQEDGPVQQALNLFKQKAPGLLRIADLCFCQYTDHGHCGCLDSAGRICHQSTRTLLVKQALSLIHAGADVIAPSGMIDRTVVTLRQAIDAEIERPIAIMNYSVKYCSQFYGPFRDAAEGAPHGGDRSTHQMNCANTHEAFAEIEQDIQEGVDMAIIKPAGHYLDVIARVHDRFPSLPLIAYQVSGEYAAIKAAINQGWLAEQAIDESLLAIKRAGASAVITYFALDWAKKAKG